MVKEEQPVLCLRIPDEEVDFEANHQIQKEEEEEEGEDDDVEQLRRILCVPRDDVVMEQNQMRIEEETTFIAKGVKRKRGHECGLCEKVFRYPSYLARHKYTHTNERPYECDVYEKRFRRSSHLQSHMRIHTNEKP